MSGLAGEGRVTSCATLGIGASAVDESKIAGHYWEAVSGGGPGGGRPACPSEERTAGKPSVSASAGLRLLLVQPSKAHAGRPPPPRGPPSSRPCGFCDLMSPVLRDCSGLRRDNRSQHRASSLLLTGTRLRGMGGGVISHPSRWGHHFLECPTAMPHREAGVCFAGHTQDCIRAPSGAVTRSPARIHFLSMSRLSHNSRPELFFRRIPRQRADGSYAIGLPSPEFDENANSVLLTLMQR